MALTYRILLALVLALSSAATAQNPPPGRPIPAVDPFAGIRAGQTVRWTAPGTGRLEGSVEGKTDTSIIIRSRGESHSISRNQIDSLWTRGNSVGRGTLIGGLLGGLLLGALALDFDRAYGGHDSGSAAMMGFAAGAAGGAFLGAIVGGAIPHWRRRVP